MTLASSLKDFSLAELFRMIDQGRKSGRLSLRTPADAHGQTKADHYIWFRQGRVVAVANSLDGQRLTSKITERNWLSQRVAERLHSLAPAGTPLGLALKTQGVVQPEQLNLLFTAQMQQLWELFGIQVGEFELDGKAPLPFTEMTGLSLPAMEVALAGLRALKNWNGLVDALPDSESAIHNITSVKPQLRLNALEWQVWEFAKGTVSLRAIAKQLNQPTAKIQQVAFRLILVGVVEEVPLMTSTSSLDNFSDSLTMHFDDLSFDDLSKVAELRQWRS